MKNMTNVFVNFVLSGFILISVSGCDDDKDVKPRGKIDREALLENFNTRVEERTQQFTVDAAEGGTITGEAGTTLMFYSNGFLHQDNTPVTGEVKIELVEIFKKSDMVLSRKPTNGRMPDGTLSTLVSGGEFYINATQDGKQLKLANDFFLSAPVENTGEADFDMFVFDGVEICDGNDCRLEWEQTQMRVDVGRQEVEGGLQSAYMTSLSRFGWTNIDKWYSDPRPKTTLYVDVPEGYDNTNCAVFLSYDGEPALASFDIYDAETGMFTEHYGLIPIGLKVHFIFVSVVDDKWNYAIQAATITENHVEVISGIKPITEAALEELIDALP